MDGKLANLLEVLNELFVLVTSYSLFLFTDLISDIEQRYELGNIYILTLFVWIIFIMIVIFVTMGIDVYKKCKLMKIKREKKKKLEEIKSR